MRLDRWTYFNLPSADRQLVDCYSSPETEASFLKDVPIQCLELVWPTVRRIEHLSGNRCRVIYRGPRPDRYQASTRKADAVRFALYFR